MAKMINCKTCGKEIAQSAKTCPSCGAKNKKPIYLRWWFILIAFFIIVGALGSGGSKTNTNTTTTATTDSATNKDQKTEKTKEEVKDVYSIGEEVALNSNKLIVNSVEKSNGSTYSKPKDGKEFVIVNVTISNGGNSEISYNPYDFEMQNSNGQITNQTFTTVNNDTAMHAGKLAPGGTITGTIAFEQPTNDTGLILKYKANMFSSKEIKVKIN